MNETAAREVLLLQAFETAQPASPSWADDDRAWATRLALQDDSVKGGAETFVVRRARHAMQRLLPREGSAATWLSRPSWRLRWVAWAVLAGLLFGVLADSVGGAQRINLLAPPLWAVVAWNLAVYLLLLAQAWARLLRRQTQPGGLVRLTQRVLSMGRSVPGAGAPNASAGTSAPALQAFASRWLRCSAALSAARAAALLHAAAAALALGLIAGLYLRGLVLDYRSTWESTFLSANTAHAALAVALAPAVAVSNLALPDLTSFEALRTTPGNATAGAAAASAAPWIHLYAITLLLFVVLPRAALALAGALRSRWLAGHMPLPLADDYFARLLRQFHGDVPRVFVLPYASRPGPQAARGLRALLAPALGDGLLIQLAPTLAFGAEDEAVATVTPPAGSTLAVALFDLSATPEADNHGRFAQQLAACAPVGAATIVLVDEAAFSQRFGTTSQRLVERRDAWRVFAGLIGTLPVFVDLDAPDLTSTPRALQLALRSPVSWVQS
jgi:hypothetical protein